MHAQGIVQRFIDTQLGSIHAARRRVLAAAVGSLMSGQALTLTRLAHGLIGTGALKGALKRIDRLIGHARIEQEAQVAAAALLGLVGQGGEPLIIAVDWSAVAPTGAFAELRASVTRPGMGRALTVYQQVHPRSEQGSARAEHALLERLHRWVSEDIPVIVVTDAGFRRRWFAHLEQLGWSWIGRIRGQVELAHGEGAWVKAARWFERANGKARRWCDCRLTRSHAFDCALVLVRKRPRQAPRYACPRQGSPTTVARKAQRSAREPWLLAHSPRLCHYRPEQIVAMYAQRMQIEENFRDTKCAQWGMGLERSRSRSAQRLHALLLIATLAGFVLWHIGQLAEAEGLQRRFKSTTRSTREISIITLALLLCTQPRIPLSDHARSTLFVRLGL